MGFDFNQKSHLALKSILTEKTSPVIAWVGAGLSAPAQLPSWESLLEHLVLEIKLKHLRIPPDDKMRSLNLTLLDEQKKQNYWLCFQFAETLLGTTTFQALIREKLDVSSHKEIPEGYSCLWDIGIQGMISFNLDQFATRSYSQKNPGAHLDLFVGAESKNLANVLQRNKPFVGNVHGVIDNSSTWIFTHQKLNQLLSDSGYINFIRSCLITRTILFIGVSADDMALKTHFEALREAGVTGVQHFWLTSRNDPETDSWSEQFNIRKILYSSFGNDHSEAIACLKDLKKITLSKDLIVQAPVLSCSIDTSQVRALPLADDLVTRPLEEIRTSLNAYAIDLLRTPSDKAYEKYEEFSIEYDEAIDRAWYVNLSPPKNILLGYTIEQKISQGSFGDVFKATDQHGNTVALKLLRRDVRRDPAMLQTFRRGVRSMEISGYA